MSSEGRPPRRMLPSVTDVVNELSRAVQADPAVLFKASRQVVAEELGRVKQGFESASIEVLARRARRLLDPAVGGTPSSPPSQPGLFGALKPGPTAPVSPAKPASPEPTEAAPATSLEEPFATSSKVDLGWEKDLPIQPDDAPFRSAILPIPRSRMPAGIAAPDATESPAAVPSAPSAPTAPARTPTAPLHGSEREPAPAPPEIESADQPEPPKPAVPAPAATPLPPMVPPKAVTSPPAPKPDPTSFLRASAPVVPSAPPPVVSGSRAAFPRSDTRPAFEPPLPPDKLQPIRPPEDAATRGSSAPQITTRDWKALGEIGVATERLRERTPKPAPAPEPEPAGVSPGAGGKAVSGWLIAVAAVLVVAAGLAYFLRDVLFVQLAPAPANVVAGPRPKAAPSTPVPATPTPAPPAAPAEPAKRMVPPSPGKTKGALIVSREWAGRPAIWVIHFTSHKDRAGAEKHAARLAAALGKTGHAIEVDLGEKGIWYRVLIGDFATQEEARAYRAELEAKKMPDLGFVYQLKGEE